MQRILKLQSKYVTNKIHHMHLYLKIINPKSFSNQITNFNKLTSESCDELITLLAILYYFTLSNARRFYPSAATQRVNTLLLVLFTFCRQANVNYKKENMLSKYNHEALLQDISISPTFACQKTYYGTRGEGSNFETRNKHPQFS